MERHKKIKISILFFDVICKYQWRQYLLFAVALFLYLFAARAQTPLWKTLPVPPPLSKADTSGFLSVEGNARMYYAVFNQQGDNPVVLIHGGFGSSDDWGFEVPLLEKTHQVVVVDCRGRGRSTMGKLPLSYELMTSDIIALLDALKLDNVS